MKKIKYGISNTLFGLKLAFDASHVYFILQLLFTLLNALVPFVNMYIWKNVINFLTDTKNRPDISYLILNVIIYMVIYLISEITARLSQYVSYKYNDKVEFFVDNLLVDKCLELDIPYFDSSETSDKIQYAGNIIYAAVSFSGTIFYTLQSAVSFVISLVLLASLNWWYVLIILALSVPRIINQFKISALDLDFYKDNAKIDRRMDYFKSLFRNTDNGFDIRLFNLKDFFIGKFVDAWGEWYKKRKETTAKSTILELINLIISSFINQILLYAIIIQKLAKRVIQIGDATYYMSVFNKFYTGVDGMILNISWYKYAFENLSTIREFLEIKELLAKDGTVEPKDFNEITFSNVSFRYPKKEEYVLRDCTFTIKKGQTVGLVGENGSGKSTIVKLLLRFYDVDEGQILIDGIDIKEYDLVKYRGMFSVLFQDFVHYGLTLRENVALPDYYGKDDDARVIDALRKSEIYDVVKDWENGLDTLMTKHYDGSGKELSGGQWQRIALARVFYSTRDFVVLDEPSASLDVFAEEKIFRQFKQLSDNRSSLIISHRLSSIVNADRIIVLKDGKIIEQGNHKELMYADGYYAELFSLQASRYISEDAEETNNINITV